MFGNLYSHLGMTTFIILHLFEYFQITSQISYSFLDEQEWIYLFKRMFKM